jgi:hypothetical protein
MAEKDTYNQDEQAIHDLYQSLSQDQPPADLDAGILRSAHDAVTPEKAAVVEFSRVKKAWYVPLSYAAVIVVSLSVVMKLALEPNVIPVETDSAPIDTEFFMEKEDRLAEQKISMPPPAAVQSVAPKKAAARQKSVKKKSKARASAGPRPSPMLEMHSRPEGKQRSMAPVSIINTRSGGVDMQDQSAAKGMAKQVFSDEVEIIEPDAENWIEQMLMLLEQGKTEQLKLEIRRFKSLYKAYILPSKLAIWEKQHISSD